MGIDEPGIHRGTLDVLHGLASVGVQDLVLFSDGHDLTFVDGHGLRLGARTIQTDNVGIANHEVHRLFGPVASDKKKGNDGKVTQCVHEGALYRWCALACAVGMMTMSLMHTWGGRDSTKDTASAMSWATSGSKPR